MQTVFLDHQSSTPVLPEAFEAMRPHFTEAWGSPSSLHRHGFRARDALDKAREQFATLIHAHLAEEIFFTSGGTEAANWAVKGVAFSKSLRGRHIVSSATEHPAVANSIAFLETQGFSCTRVGVDRQGRIDPDSVRAAITDETVLVCIHHANHDVGTLQPVREVAQVANERGVPVFVDAVASAGWEEIDVQAMGVALLALSPHRFYGPKGVGVLYRNRSVRLANLVHGGDQEQGRRGGTQNVPAIVGGGVAAQVAACELDARRGHARALQKNLWEQIKANVPFVALHGPEPGLGRHCANLNVSAEFTEGEGQLLSLDMAGIAVASGTSCVSRAVKVSPVLEAMGVDRALAQASILFSLGKDNTESEIAHAAAIYAKVIERLRSMSPLWEDYQNGLIDSVIQPRGGGPGTGS